MAKDKLQPEELELRRILAELVRKAKKTKGLKPGQEIGVTLRVVNNYLRVRWSYDICKQTVAMRPELTSEEWERLRALHWPQKYAGVISKLVDNNNAGVTEAEVRVLTGKYHSTAVSQINQVLKLVPGRFGLRIWYANRSARGVYRIFHIYD